MEMDLPTYTCNLCIFHTLYLLQKKNLILVLCYFHRLALHFIAREEIWTKTLILLLPTCWPLCSWLLPHQYRVMVLRLEALIWRQHKKIHLDITDDDIVKPGDKHPWNSLMYLNALHSQCLLWITAIYSIKAYPQKWSQSMAVFYCKLFDSWNFFDC